MSHSAHPDIHAAGLAEDCDRCDEIGDDPFGMLDSEALNDLVTRTLANRFGGRASPFGLHVLPRSMVEERAMGVVMTRLEQTGQTLSTAPEPTRLYLRERWRVES